MNQDLENKLPGTESDPAVSAEYQATATERTPPALDAAVLKKAETAVKESGLQGFTAFWFRPLAFAASLGIALALVLEFTSIETLQPTMDPGLEVGRQELESLHVVPSGSADNLKTERYYGLDAPAGRQQSVEAPDPAPGLTSEIKGFGLTDSANVPVENAGVSADFVEMMETSSKRMRDPESVRKTTIQDLSQTREIENVQAENVSEYRTPTAVTILTIRSCTEEQVAVPLMWWHCISDLDEAGRHEEAKAELQLFNRAHPHFEAPHNLPSK